MPQHYRFSPEGLLEPCEKDEAGSLGGFRYYNSEKVKEYSEGRYDKGGWVAAYVAGPSHYAGSDDLGTQGVLNPVNGKRYDSRSAYMQSVKDAGCVIVGDDAPTHAPKQKPINWEKAVAQTLKSTPLKGK